MSTSSSARFSLRQWTRARDSRGQPASAATRSARCVTSEGGRKAQGDSAVPLIEMPARKVAANLSSVTHLPHFQFDCQVNAFLIIAIETFMICLAATSSISSLQFLFCSCPLRSTKKVLSKIHFRNKFKHEIYFMKFYPRSKV